MTPEPMIVQHDDRAIYYRRRCERTERSEICITGSFEYPTDAIGDAVMIARKANSKQFRWTRSWKYLFGRCVNKAAVRHITHKL